MNIDRQVEIMEAIVPMLPPLVGVAALAFLIHLMPTSPQKADVNAPVTNIVQEIFTNNRVVTVSNYGIMIGFTNNEVHATNTKVLVE